MEHSKKRIITTTIVGLILFVLGILLFIVGLSIKRPVITFYDTDGETIIGTEKVAIGRSGGAMIPGKKSELPGYSYTFVGWRIEDETTGTSEVVRTIEVKEDKPIKAVAVYNRIALPYEIKYNLNGGYLDLTTAPTVYNVTQAVELPIPTRKGYTFAGWYKGTTYGNKLEVINKGTTGEIKLTAKWEAEVYTITYDLNDGIQAENPLTTYTIETVSKLPVPQKDGFTFGGWLDEEGNLVGKITAGMTGDLNLKARWINKINYNLNGGLNSSDAPDTYEFDVDVVLPTPTKYGYVFLGWCMKEDLSDEPLKVLNTTTPAGVELYAKWQLPTDGTVVVENGIKYIYFGKYPQTVVYDYATIQKLDQLCQNNISYLEGEKYIKVFATPTIADVYKFNGKVEYLLDKNILSSNLVSKRNYYFKVLPIKWRVISEENGKLQLLSEYALAAQTFGTTNDYSTSVVRKWLNETFYNEAFTDVEKTKVQLTEVDNSDATTASRTDNPFASTTTKDYVYLMSYKEVTKVKYGFISSHDECDPAKYCEATEYARALGAGINMNSSYFGYTDWMLRSPFITAENSISVVRGIGDSKVVGTVERWAQSNAVYAVRPMVTIVLQ